MPAEPIGIETQPWIDGVVVGASAPGAFYMTDANGVLQSQLPLQGQIEETMFGPQLVLGVQQEASSGFIAVKAGGQIGIDTHVNYALGTDNADELSGNVVYGFGGDDRLVAGSGQQSPSEFEGPIMVVGGAGDDTMTGNHGSTMFQLGGGSGTDTITNFAPGMDQLYVMNPFAMEPEMQNSYLGRSTTLYQSLDQFIGDVNGHNMATENATGVTIGQVGQDTYVLVDNDGQFGTVTKGMDSIVKLEGVSVLDLDWTSIGGINEGDLQQWGDGSINGTPIGGDNGGDNGGGIPGDGGTGFPDMPPDFPIMPTISTVASAHYWLDDGAIALTTTADGAVNGFGNASGFGITNAMTELPVETSGFSFWDNALQIGASPEIGVYHMSWQSGTFTTDTAEIVLGGELYYAGGFNSAQDYSYTVDVKGFTVNAPTYVAGSFASDNGTVSNDFIRADSLQPSTIHTGGGHDVVSSANTGPMTLQYDSVDQSASDLVLGFQSGMSTVALSEVLGNLVDQNHSGSIEWTASFQGPVEASDSFEGLVVKLASVISMTNMDVTASTLNDLVDVSASTQNHSMLILANGETDGALYLYQNLDGNGTIDANELTTISVFADGVAHANDIVVVGTFVNSGGGIPGGDI